MTEICSEVQKDGTVFHWAKVSDAVSVAAMVYRGGKEVGIEADSFEAWMSPDNALELQSAVMEVLSKMDARRQENLETGDPGTGTFRAHTRESIGVIGSIRAVHPGSIAVMRDRDEVYMSEESARRFAGLLVELVALTGDGRDCSSEQCHCPPLAERVWCLLKNERRPMAAREIACLMFDTSRPSDVQVDRILCVLARMTGKFVTWRRTDDPYVGWEAMRCPNFL